MKNESTMLVRHADKGKWKINEDELRREATQDEANLILGVLKRDYPHSIETPLQLKGLLRSIRLGDKLYNEQDTAGVIVSINSGKDRAKLTNSLVTARIAQRESIAQKKGKDKKRVDMLQVEAKELTSLLADSSHNTWAPYGEMMENEGIDESEAIALWLNDMNKDGHRISDEVHPKEAAERYRSLVRVLRKKVTSEQVPITIFGVGHSGSVGQIKRESYGRDLTSNDSPDFCESYRFDTKGNFISSDKTEI